MNLLPIVARLEESGVAVAGQTLFISFMPPSSSGGILLMDPFGGTKVNQELPGYYKASFVMVARSAEMDTTKQLMADAIVALTIKVDTNIDGTLFKYMRARNLPFAYAPSPGQQVEMSVNMDCCFIDSGA